MRNDTSIVDNLSFRRIIMALELVEFMQPR